jgi:hypothetical protein
MNRWQEPGEVSTPFCEVPPVCPVANVLSSLTSHMQEETRHRHKTEVRETNTVRDSNYHHAQRYPALDTLEPLE